MGIIAQGREKGDVMQKKILVTGGAGFIGSHIVEEAVRRGHKVLIVDNLSSGKLQNLDHINQANLRIHNADIRDRIFINELFEKESFDLVFHEAAIASVQKSIVEPEYTYNVNVVGSNNIFEAAVKTNVQKVVFASSAAVYGDNPDLPKTEDMDVKPVSPYGDHKLMNEKSALAYSWQGTTQFVALRYFNVYGQRQDPASEYSGVISIFLDKISRGETVTIFGDGQQTRDFVYVKDIVQANYLSAEKGHEDFNVYNVGTETQTSVKQLAEIIHDVYSKSYRINHEEAREGDIKFSYSSIKKIRSIGFNPDYSVSQGIQGITLRP